MSISPKATLSVRYRFNDKSAEGHEKVYELQRNTSVAKKFTVLPKTAKLPDAVGLLLPNPAHLSYTLAYGSKVCVYDAGCRENVSAK